MTMVQITLWLSVTVLHMVVITTDNPCILHAKSPCASHEVESEEGGAPPSQRFGVEKCRSLEADHNGRGRRLPRRHRRRYLVHR